MRRSGRTYRRVLQALRLASGGNYVVYVSHTRPHLDHAILMAKTFSDGYASMVYRDEIRFASGGRVLFRTKDRDFSGLPDAAVYDIS